MGKEFKLPPRPTLEEAKTRELTTLELQALLVDFIDYENKRFDELIAYVNKIGHIINDHDHKIKQMY